MKIHKPTYRVLASPQPSYLSAAFALTIGLLLSATLSSPAQALFSDNFDGYSTPVTVTSAGTTNGYKILFGAAAGVSDFKAIFGFDYSTVTYPLPIPPAPNTVGNTTKGLYLTVNKDSNGQAAAVNLYPTNQSFSGNFVMRCDVWINWTNTATSTEHTLFGINHSGNITNRIGQATSDGLFFAMNGDGGSSATSTTVRDYSVFRGGGAGVAPALVTDNTKFGPIPPLGPNFDNADPGISALFPPVSIAGYTGGGTAAGAAGLQWVTCEIRQETNVVTWSLNNTVVAQYTNTSAYGSGNILLGYNDVFGSIGDINNYVIFDNISVTSLGGLPVASVTATIPVANEAGPVSGQYAVVRGGDVSGPLTVNYVMSGTASNGLDYVTLPGSVTFAAGASVTNITLTPIHDGISEPTETAILSLASGTGYTVGSPSAATVAILDSDTPAVSISGTQPVLLEGVPGSTVPLTLTRIGLTNTALTVNIAYSGGAVKGNNFTGPATVSIPGGATTASFNLTPINDNIVEGTQNAIVSVATGSGYVPNSPSSTTNIIVDDDVLPGTQLFFDAFDSPNTATNWIVNASSDDAYVQFGYDYSADGIPEAPSSAGHFVPQHGVKFRANEIDAAIAGISISPTNGDFEGNYRLRFDMWLNYAGPLNNANVPGQTQAGEAGVGTTGFEPMWPAGGAGDAVWFTATCDGGSGGTSGDYNVFEGSTFFSDDSGVFAAGTTNAPRDNFNPYYLPWPAVSAPASVTNAHPTETGTTLVGTFGMAWHKVAITVRNGVVTWGVDGLAIATVDTSIYPVTLSPNVFIGFNDPFPSVTTNPACQFGLFDNVRVETLGRPLVSQTSKTGSTVTISFMGEVGDATTDFEVQTAPAAPGPYSLISATITQVDATHFTATVTSAASSAYFRVRRL